jgi:hypothetical protein
VLIMVDSEEVYLEDDLREVLERKGLVLWY